MRSFAFTLGRILPECLVSKLLSPHLMRWSTLALLVVVVLAAAVGSFFGFKISARSSAFVAPTAAVSSNHPTAAEEKSGGTAAVEPAPTDAGLPWSDRWRTATEGVSTPARDRALVALIEQLARTDPQKALALAQAEGNWRLRDLLRNAALRGWASVAPMAAADWALTVRPEERRSAVEALLQGAAANPDAAVKTALHLCQSDPEPAGDYGHYTIAALVDAGAFKEAVQFGNQVGTEKYPFLLKSAFFQWSRNQPNDAMAAVNGISDPVLRAQAYGEAISGWAWSDAKAVAQYALQLPSGSARTDAFAEALPRWVEKDPVAATEWINRQDSGPEFDSGIVAVANHQSMIQGQPSTAMALAGNISDPSVRSHTLRAVFRQWATNDLTAARSFIASTANAGDRALLTDELKDLSPN